MILHHGIENLKFKKPVVTLGIFDGVHRGHRMLLDSLIFRAAEINGESVVITFHPHPRLVLEKKKTNLTFLSTMDEKINLLEEAMIDHLVILEFTSKFSKMNACDFVEKILVEKIGTKHLIIGHDHHFGFKGEGNYKTINDCAQSMNFRVEQIEGFRMRKEAVSSSLIRNALLKGNLDEANKCLGYTYSIKGKVVAGKRLGRLIGFPTANLKPCDKYKLIPGNGVYAVDIQLCNDQHKGMLSIGTNPTVNRNTSIRTIEVNIFNFEGDLYGKEIKIFFRHRMRDEKKFESIDQLSIQMKADRDNALQLLS